MSLLAKTVRDGIHLNTRSFNGTDDMLQCLYLIKFNLLHAGGVLRGRPTWRYTFIALHLLHK